VAYRQKVSVIHVEKAVRCEDDAYGYVEVRSRGPPDFLLWVDSSTVPLGFLTPSVQETT